MAAIGVADVIALGQSEIGPGRHALLPLAEMGRAMDQPVEIAAMHLILELADAHHHLVEPEALRLVEGRDRAVMSLAGRRCGDRRALLGAPLLAGAVLPFVEAFIPASPPTLRIPVL